MRPVALLRFAYSTPSEACLYQTQLRTRPDRRLFFLARLCLARPGHAKQVRASSGLGRR